MMAEICLPELMGEAEWSSKLQLEKGVFSLSARKSASSSSPAAERGRAGAEQEPARPAVSGGDSSPSWGCCSRVTVGQALGHGECQGTQ